MTPATREAALPAPETALLAALPAALAVFDADRTLRAFNAAFAELGLFPKSLLKPGRGFAEFQRRDATLKRRGPGPHEVSLPGGEVLRLHKRALPKRRLLLCYENVTAGRLAAERLELVTRASSEGTYDWDIANDTIYYSDRVYESLGLKRGDFRTPRDWYDRIHPDDRAHYYAALLAHYKGETQRFECDYRFRTARGGWRWARQHGIGIRDAQGKVVRMVGSTGDIDPLKRLEQALAASEARYALATQAATEGIYDWNVGTGDLYLSDRAKVFFAIRGRKLTPAIWNSRIHPEDFPAYRKAVKGLFKGEAKQLEQVYRIRNAAGGHAWITDRAVAVRDDDGRVHRLVGAITDITARKQAEIDLQRSHDETAIALARQSAIADILRTLNASATDVQPTFRAILDSTTRLCDSNVAALFLFDGEFLTCAAHRNTTRAFARALDEMHARPSGDTTTRLAALERRVVLIDDYLNDKRFTAPAAQAGEGVRTIVSVPLLRGETLVGVITTWRREVRPFDAAQVGLLETFADQAVIAIQNVRLFNETKEALERQTATAEILAAMSDSMTDAQPVFDAIVRNLRRLFNTRFAVVQLLRGKMIEMPAADGEPGFERLREYYPRPLDDTTIGARTMLARRVIQTSPMIGNPEAAIGTQEFAREFGFNAALFAPMLRGEAVIGVIGIAHREPRVFDDEEVALIKAFADQAVIAIENVRLFNETKEALERQTATAEILRVIASSPSDVQPVFEAIARSAMQLIGGRSAFVARRVDDALHLAALTATTAAGDEALRSSFPTPLTGRAPLGRAVLEGKPVFVSDFDSDLSLPPAPREIARARGTCSLLAVPMLRGGASIGGIAVTRDFVGAFTDHQINLLQTFADQAVIAIENVRLFNETKEALERQTATAEILKVIASSPSDVQPVFEAIAASARNLLAGGAALVARREGDKLELLAYTSSGDVADAALLKLWPAPITGKGHMGQAILSGAPAGSSDLQNDEHYSEAFRVSARARGVRSVVSVPMLREGEPIGVISVNRPVPGEFSEHQTNLLRTFADQAVIAIENVRLFNELKSRTDALTRSVGQLTALGEVGQAISSTLDVEMVLKTIVSHAMRLTGLDAGVIYEYDIPSERFQLRASENFDDESVATLRGAELRVGEGAVGTSVSARKPTQVSDTHAPDYPVRLREMLDRPGFRAVLAVPLLREDQIIGALMMLRRSPGPFPEEVVELLSTFASQSALAIQNARLFREIGDKGHELEVANQHKSEFLANMSHELRTPLNAIIGFSEALDERYFGELNDKQAEYVKDIHGSGRHLLSLINDILDLSKIEAGRMDLDLSEFEVVGAIDNALTLVRERAERHGLKLGRELDPALGSVQADERKMKQILLNLLSNAVKFTPEGGRITVRARRNGALLKVDVVDTGVGIAAEDQAAVFEEFRQVGNDVAAKAQGTGLGLALTKRFVELHGGTIGLESEPGKGTTFTFTLPLRRGE